MLELGRYPVLGVSVDAVDYEAAIARILRAAEQGRSYAVSALAVHGIMTGVLNPEQRRRLNSLDLVLPDGQPVRWGLSILHRVRLKDRVYGPELTLLLCREAARRELPVYFYGSTPEVLSALVARLQSRIPNLIVAGSRPSRFRALTEVEHDDVVAEIETSGAKILFVGMGCPRQEVFCFENSAKLPMPLVAVGAAFDFHAGTLKQAPPVLRRFGLEWLFRLAAEPKRLWKRYLFLNPPFVALLVADFLAIYRVNSEPDASPKMTYVG